MGDEESERLNLLKVGLYLFDCSRVLVFQAIKISNATSINVNSMGRRFFPHLVSQDQHSAIRIRHLQRLMAVGMYSFSRGFVDSSRDYVT